MNIAISICCLAIATPSKSRHDNDFLVPLIAPTLAFAFLFLYPENNIDDYENHFAKLSAKLSQDKFDIPAIIFKPSGDEKYLIKLKLKEAGRQFYLYPDETDLPPLELGRGFKAAPNPNTLGELKEMLLYTGKVRTVNLSAIDSGDDMPERFDKWAKTVANKKCGYGINADFCLYEMTRAVPKDGILLDLQINHYGDMENAARLMTSKTFYPKMFRAYFLASGSDVVAAVEKLMFACGGDSACEREAARKIENYAVVAGKTDIQAAVAPYIEKRPSEAGGR